MATAYPFPTFAFLLNVTGDNTGTELTGNFEAKQRLSHRDYLNKDAFRRSLIGDRADQAATDTMVRAEMLSHLKASIVDAPKWWRESSDGLDLYDDNVVFDLYNKVVEGQNKAVEAIQKKGEEAKERLRERAKEAKEKPEEIHAPEEDTLGK